MKKSLWCLISIMLMFVVVLTSCSNATSNSQGESSDNNQGSNESKAEIVFDVSKFANISGQQLISILGQPNNITQTTERGFTTFPCELYDYENHELGFLRFDLINDKVTAISINGELPYNGGNVLETLNVEIENDDYFSEGDMYKKWECPTSTIDLVHITVIDNEKDVYKSLSVEFDSQYYHEWNMPIYAGTISPGEYRVMVEDLIKSMCYSPKSADFPTLDWEYARNDYYFCVESYVDAKNAFGAEVRHSFSVVYHNDTKTVVYVILDNEVVADNGYVPTADIVKGNVQKKPSGNNSNSDNKDSNQTPNTNTNTNSNKNNLYDVQDAVIEYCNKYNANSRKYSESIGCFVDSGTQVRISHSAYNIPESDSSYIYSARDTMLNNLISHLEKYGFPQSITVTVEENYNFSSSDYEEDDTPVYEDNNNDWVYEENDINTLTAAVNAFCSDHHACDYDCTLNPKITSKTSVDIYHTIDYDIPIADTQKISAIDKQIKTDAEAFVSNYANFPEGITFSVIPDYWYATSNNEETLDSAMAAFVSDYQCAYGAITYKLSGATYVTINYDVSRDVPQSELNEVQSQIRKDAEEFVGNYADFPENITFQVFPNYWYEPNQ